MLRPRTRLLKGFPSDIYAGVAQQAAACRLQCGHTHTFEEGIGNCLAAATPKILNIEASKLNTRQFVANLQYGMVYVYSFTETSADTLASFPSDVQNRQTSLALVGLLCF